ncbi:ferredoxin--NADP reductase [Altibacter sp. HG106]|uniref:ferredoxin--NADP reductase n=1 Tax=Altibacter sp. HG106 TaxID=3023937 RepID=UPI00234FE058|nr:ferredoxin--NADP reductase [Altibacter sp. HG106]MDC7995022.1 ferredoxin--NADP reductase [Altibacter sp. HG106]
MNRFHSLTLSEVTKETPNAVCLTFKIPDALRHAFQFEAGQYITIKHRTADGTELRRAYSICSTPDSEVLRVGVKKVTDGSFSIFANTKLKAGDTLEVMPPEGTFTLDAKNAEGNIAAFAAGSGITPILSIVTTALEASEATKVLLVYGNQTFQEAMFADELHTLQERFPERFHLHYVLSRMQDDDALFGRIDRSRVNYFLKNKYEDFDFSTYYLCGPEPMIDEVSSTLKEHGVNEKFIRFELFTTSEEGALTETHDGSTQVTLTLDDVTETFRMEQENSVLQAAIDAGMDPPYSCQGGICSTCIARITEGKVEMRKNQILTDDELAEGYILTCQSHPTTPTITVDYDDI